MQGLSEPEKKLNFLIFLYLVFKISCSAELSMKCFTTSRTGKQMYRIYSAMRRGFSLSRMTTNNEISPMKFCYDTSFTLLKQSKISRSSRC